MTYPNRLGRVVSGSRAGLYFRVEDDRNDSGGYYVFLAPTPDQIGQVYDDWVSADEGGLESYFSSLGPVEWLESEPGQGC